MKNALLQHQKINHVVTKKPKNVERMKGIVIRTVIAKQVSSVALIIVPVVSHRTMTAVIIHHHQVHQVHLISNVLTITRYFNMIISYLYVKNALLQHQKINHAVTKKPKNVERMKGIAIMTVIANLVSHVVMIIVQVVSHLAMTVAIYHQVKLALQHHQ